MNWYKRSQAVQDQEIENYTSIGHYDYADHIDPQGDKKITLWISNIAGENFQMEQVSTRTGAVHENIWDLKHDRNFWGRHDPIKNIVSIILPYMTGKHTPITVEEIPNRLIKVLENRFPGSAMYAFPYNDDPTRII